MLGPLNTIELIKQIASSSVSLSVLYLILICVRNYLCGYSLLLAFVRVSRGSNDCNVSRNIKKVYVTSKQGFLKKDITIIKNSFAHEVYRLRTRLSMC